MTLVIPAITIADWCPCPADACTAAAKEDIVIEFISLGGGPASCPQLPGCTLNGQDDGAVVWSSEYVSSEPILARFPTERIGLAGKHACYD